MPARKRVASPFVANMLHAPVRVAVARLPPTAVAAADTAEVTSSHLGLREADVLERSAGSARVGGSRSNLWIDPASIDKVVEHRVFDPHVPAAELHVGDALLRYQPADE